ESIHLDQELIERLLALVVTAAQSGAAMAADGVDLIDEDDARRVFLSLLEQIADARRAHADEHLDEIRSGDREERRVGLARDRAREKRLASARRSHQQNALRNLAAELGELLRLFEKLDDLVQLELGLIDARNILERDFLGAAGEQLGLRL